jgi:hypothetical protein
MEMEEEEEKEMAEIEMFRYGILSSECTSDVDAKKMQKEHSIPCLSGMRSLTPP